MTKEEATYRLASAYIKEYRQVGGYLFTMKNVDRTKWIKFFERAAGYRSIVGWSPEEHVKSCFEKHGKILPFRIFGKTAIEAWEEYNHRYKNKIKNDYIVQMLDSYKKIKKWNKQEYDPTYYRSNILLMKRKTLSIYLLCLSKEYRILNKEQHYYTEEELDIKRVIVFTNKKVWNKMIEVLKDDFYQKGE